MKDANDLLLAGISINDMPTVDINIYCAEQILIKYPDKQQQYKAIDKYIRTISNELVKGDIAVILARHWDKDVQDVRTQFSVKTEATDEKLADFADLYSCFTALDKTLNQEEIGIGYASVDANVTFRRKWVVLLGAYSGSGKTNNLIEFILHWCVRLKKKVLFFSLEMPREDVIEVIIGKIIGKPQHQVRSLISTEVYRQVADKIGKYLYIIDKNNLSINDIEDYIKLANSRVYDSPVDIACIDYFGYLKKCTGYEEEATTAKRMKEIAKDNNIVFFMLSQFNKESQRQGKEVVKEPSMNDLKGAGDISASADIVYLLWRPGLASGLGKIEEEKLRYKTILKIGKARKGLRKGQTHFELLFDPATGRIREY